MDFIKKNQIRLDFTYIDIDVIDFHLYNISFQLSNNNYDNVINNIIAIQIQLKKKGIIDINEKLYNIIVIEFKNIFNNMNLKNYNKVNDIITYLQNNLKINKI
jgi:hypothetical protein